LPVCTCGSCLPLFAGGAVRSFVLVAMIVL
jgi:hypothetical protein